MLSAVALVPSPPLLVPELTGPGAGETLPFRTAAVNAARALGERASRWLVLGSGERTDTIDADQCGSFAGYGVDVRVALSPSADRFDADLALPALVAGWLRGVAAESATATVDLVGTDESATACVEHGRALAAELDADAENWGVLVVGDGATTLTARAPGSFDPRAEHVQNDIDDALATADVAALVELDRGLCGELGVGGVPVWQALAGLVGDRRVDPRTLYRGAPFGVGYFVGIWELA